MTRHRFVRLEKNNTLDTYFTLLTAGIAYPFILFLLLLLPLKIFHQRTSHTHFSINLPFQLHWRISTLGIVNAISGVLTLAASPNTRTPPFIQQGLFTLGPFFTAILNVVFLKESMSHYINKIGIVSLVCLVASFALALERTR